MVNTNLEIENAVIGRGSFRNFSGEKSTYNPFGKRTFTILLDEVEGLKLEKEGWHIRWREPRDEDEERIALLSVEVKFGDYPPKVMLISGNNRTLLDESNIAVLDNAEIAKADVVIRPYNWEVNGKTGVKAYAKALYFTIQDDDFGGRYSD